MELAYTKSRIYAHLLEEVAKARDEAENNKKFI
jgi:hypothetical protein